MKFIITTVDKGEVHYLCVTNYSKSYGAGVMEFESKESALREAEKRGINNPKLFEIK